MPNISLDQVTFERLQRHAKAFVDTPDTVICRALDALEKVNVGTDAPKDTVSSKEYTLHNLPNLTHTKVTRATINGQEIRNAKWNTVLDAVLVAAVKSKMSTSEIRAFGGINVVEKKKNDEGFHELEGTNLSVQGQDSNRACLGSLAIGKKIGLAVTIEFVWRDKEGATYPGKSAVVRV